MAAVVSFMQRRRQVLLLCLAYLLAWLVLDVVARLVQTRAEVSLWYLPTGLTFALLLVFGVRFVPVLPLTDVLHGLLIRDPQVGWASVLARALLTSAVYGAAAWLLLHRARIDPRLVQQRDVLWFLGVACLAAPLLVAVVQVVLYDLLGVLRWRDLPVDVFGFWSGSATGIGVVGSSLLVLSRSWPQLWPGRPALDPEHLTRHLTRQLNKQQTGGGAGAEGRRVRRGLLEPAGQAAALLGCVYLAFGPPADGSLDLASLVYLPLLWVAVRGGFVPVVAAVLVVNITAVALAAPTVQEHPLRLQLGLMTMTLAGLALGALVSQRWADVQAARFAAVHDPLTGLANRVLLADRIEAAVRRHARDPSALLAVLYLDLDGFKGINDDLGHDAGDELLVAVARRLEQTVRPGDLVSRLGGDEFVVLLDAIEPDQVAVVAERAAVALRQPHQVAGHEVLVTVSIGVAVSDPDLKPDLKPDPQPDPAPGVDSGQADNRGAGSRLGWRWPTAQVQGGITDGGASQDAGPDGRERLAQSRASTRGGAAHRMTEAAESLLQAGDAALQQAKAQGGDRVELFTPPLRELAHDRLQLQAALRRAVDDEAIDVAYQPVFALPSGQLVAVEALARWRDRQRGQVEPGVFIAVAEQTGLIHDLGRHVMDRACRQLAAWQSAGAGRVRLAVNLSPRQLLAPALAAQVLAVLHRHQLAPEDLELEITESTAMDLAGPAGTNLRSLRDAGVRLVVDDFGTGWSSFQSLRDLAPDTLKLDRSLVAGLGADEASTAIVQAVLAMAGHLRMTVTAEGVENPEQLALLRQLRCAHVQGFHLGRPVSSEQIRSLLTHPQGSPATAGPVL